MSIYLDASVLVAMFRNDPLTARAIAFLRGIAAVLMVSDFAAAEFASAVSLRVRTGELAADAAQAAFANFDAWTGRATQRIGAGGSDIAAADAYLRRLDLTLRAPDAINIAIAARLGADLVTFDERMAASARAVGVTVAEA